MSIEQHPGPHPEREPTPAPAPVPTPAPADAGAALARLLHGLTTAVLALPTDERDAGTHPDNDADVLPATDEAPAAPVRERRTGSLLAELTFLDD
ncbi:hypothetical protein [uncultured Nocardioides sp.]|uniref:hypothetical protein n=1 Tax=uncultured Nocardioides sp. TaxID=198441 RepID=UPI00260752CD|nr:hypothetical protein [uncultured Nocardioides sp.]